MFNFVTIMNKPYWTEIKEGTTVKDIKVNFLNENDNNVEKVLDKDNKFVSLSSQLSKEYSNWDVYGSQLIDRL